MAIAGYSQQSLNPRDIYADYKYRCDQDEAALKTANEVRMQEYLAQQQLDLAKYEAEQRIKQQLQYSIMYGTSFSKENFEDLVVPKRSGKEECPELYRLLKERRRGHK